MTAVSLAHAKKAIHIQHTLEIHMGLPFTITLYVCCVAYCRFYIVMLFLLPAYFELFTFILTQRKLAAHTRALSGFFPVCVLAFFLPFILFSLQLISFLLVVVALVLNKILIEFVQFHIISQRFKLVSFKSSDIWRLNMYHSNVYSFIIIHFTFDLQ